MRRRLRSAAIVAALGVAVPLAGATAAQAYEIESFSSQITNQDGTFASQAGGHPWQGVIAFDTRKTANGNNEGQTKTIRVDTPPGLVPNPVSVPECTQPQLDANSCPPASQIGMTRLRLSKIFSDGGTAGSPGNPFGLPAGTRGDLVLDVGLYNMTPNANQLARFSFNPTQPGGPAVGHTVDIEGAMRPSDNGLYFTINNVSRPTAEDPAGATLTGSTLTFWGTPGAAERDAQRGASRLTLVGLNGTGQVPAPILQAAPGGVLAGTAPTGATGVTNRDAAFLSGPTVCNGPQKATLTLDSYQGDRRTRDDIVGEETNGATGCDQVPFGSTTTFGVSSLQRDAPTPLAVQLDVPQTATAGTLATSHVKRVAVTLPPGMTISPSAANGLEACTDAQFAQGTSDAISCPAASRVGSTTLKSPVLANALTGSVYIGQPLSGNRYRLFVHADGYGASIRLKGTVTPDPVTGQVSAVFDDNPQLPFSQFRLDFDGGSDAIIASPQSCGTATGSGTLTPWSGTADSTTSSSVTVENCSGSVFAPTFTASTANGTSGKYAPLAVSFARPDGNEFLSSLKATLPAGMTAKIKGVVQCTEAQIAAESCPAESRVATVNVKAGPGSAPYALTGPAYLTGSYKGGAFGTVAIIHVVAGPYDLGNVVVRQALRIDPETAQVTVDSDPLPQIKEGILLRMRDLNLVVDRTNFVRNPTSCGTKTISSSVTSIVGTTVARDAGVAFKDCVALPFRPKISLAFGNKTQMKKGGHPRVTAVVKQFESEAGIKSTQVALPKQVALQASNAKGLCEKSAAAKNACPKSSIVGSASAVSTVLNRKVTGPVYFVKGTRITAAGKEVATLPTFFIPLSGEVKINLRASSSVNNDRLVTTFASIPDQPITNFTLNIDGGKNGIIAATRDLCTAKAKAAARFVSWNGEKAPTRNERISTACKKK
jgi:hypothetical protein